MCVCVLPVWPCLPAITPLSGDIKIQLSWKDATAETSMPAPTQYKDPGVGQICHICMFHSLTEREEQMPRWGLLLQSEQAVQEIWVQ